MIEAHVHDGADARDSDGWSMARHDIGGAQGERGCHVHLTCAGIRRVRQTMMRLWRNVWVRVSHHGEARY